MAHSTTILSDKIKLLSVVCIAEDGELIFNPDPKNHGELWFYINDDRDGQSKSPFNRYVVDKNIERIRRVMLQDTKSMALNEHEKLFEKEAEQIKIAIERFDM